MNSSVNALWLQIKPLFFIACVILISLTISRLILINLYQERVSSENAFKFVLVQGLRFDLLLIGIVLVIPFLAFPLLTTSSSGLVVWKTLLSVYLAVVVMLIVFMELATPAFAEQFDARPNNLFFDYLEYPKEIFQTLWGAYRVQLVVGVPITLLIGLAAYLKLSQLFDTDKVVPFFVSLPAGLLFVILCAMAIRSTLAHRPVNPATVALTKDSFVNELPLNSTYSLGYAAYERRYEKQSDTRFGHLPISKAVALVRQLTSAKPHTFLDDTSTWRLSESQHTRREPPKNLVIILEESLGAEFVGSLGGLDLTPNLDALADQGIWFESLYATGTRSVRGIEAVVTGFPPTASRSVVKLGKSQRDFFTLAALLKQNNYSTSFIYGGESHFDNMRRFFVGNGFETIIDEKNYIDPVFTGSWGVSDEDLLNRAHLEFSAEQEQPFFSLVFSSSNHTPFEFPDGRIELFDEKKQTVNNAVKYADYALGEFFKKARNSSYWDNTVFLVVADHNSRVYGDSLVPIERFHIPAVIVGGGIEPMRYSKLASQIDLGPTLLAVMGLEVEHPMPGRDLIHLPDSVAGRAMMQFNGIQAYREEEKVVILQNGKTPTAFNYQDGQLIENADSDIELVEKALAYPIWANSLYHARQYTSDPSRSTTLKRRREATLDR